jgi:hypothetical protein
MVPAFDCPRLVLPHSRLSSNHERRGRSTRFSPAAALAPALTTLVRQTITWLEPDSSRRG